MFGAKIRKNVYPCKPQFYHIKAGCKGVYITRTCYHDGVQYYNASLKVSSPSVKVQNFATIFYHLKSLIVFVSVCLECLFLCVEFSHLKLRST